jgi:hypothetical protein
VRVRVRVRVRVCSPHARVCVCVPQVLSKGLIDMKVAEIEPADPPGGALAHQPFHLPAERIVSVPRDELERDVELQYTMDGEDAAFLDRLNAAGVCPSGHLSAEDLERIVDRLEKDSHFALVSRRFVQGPHSHVPIPPHSSAHPPAHPYTHPLILPSVHLPAHFPTCPPSHSSAHSSAHSPIHLFTHSPTPTLPIHPRSLIYPLLIHPLTP